MANIETTITGQTGNGPFAVTGIEFLDVDRVPLTDQVRVVKNGSLLNPGVDYQDATSGDNYQLYFTTPLVPSDTVAVSRVTPTENLVTFVDGSAITAADLNVIYDQPRHVVEELSANPLEATDLDDLGNVGGGGTPGDLDILVYNSSQQLWEYASQSTIGVAALEAKTAGIDRTGGPTDFTTEISDDLSVDGDATITGDVSIDGDLDAPLSSFHTGAIQNDGSYLSSGDIGITGDILSSGSITSNGKGTFNTIEIQNTGSYGSQITHANNAGFYLGRSSVSSGGVGASALYATAGGNFQWQTQGDVPFQVNKNGDIYIDNTKSSGPGGTMYPGKNVFQARSEGYAYFQSAYENTTLNSNQKTFVLINPQGAQLDRAGQGGSTWLMQGKVAGDPTFRFGNEGQAHFYDQDSQIMLRPKYLGNASQMTIAQFDSSGSHPSGVKYNWFVKGTGVMTCYGFHNYCDETLKDFTGSQSVADATAALRDIDIKSYKYKSDLGTTTYGFSAQDLLDKGLDTYGIVQEVAAQAEQTDISEVPDDDDNAASSETVVTAGNADDGTTVYEVDNLGLSALTIQSVQEVDARVTTLENATPPTGGGIDSNTTDAGTGSAIQNMVTATSGQYGALGFTPDPDTIYFVTA